MNSVGPSPATTAAAGGTGAGALGAGGAAGAGGAGGIGVGEPAEVGSGSPDVAAPGEGGEPPAIEPEPPSDAGDKIRRAIRISGPYHHKPLSRKMSNRDI